MTILTPTLVSGRDSSGDNINRDLEQVVSNIDRQDTPFYSSIGSRKVKSVTHEWLTDDYDNATFQAFSENLGLQTATESPRRVLNNNSQIFRGSYGVSATAVAVHTAGVANEFNYQAMKSGVFVRRNVEAQWLASGGNAEAVQRAQKSSSNGTGTTDGRRAGSVYTYAGVHQLAGDYATGTNQRALAEVSSNGTTITDNVTGANLDTAAEVTARNNAITGSTAGWRSDGSRQVTPRLTGTGAVANVSRADINKLLADMYSQGARPTMAMMSPTVKVNLSTALFADGVGTNVGLIQRMDAMEKKINMAITTFETDFGFVIGAVPNWLHNNVTGTGRTDPQQILFYDPAMIKTGILRPLAPKRDIGQDQDGLRGFVTCEKTLIVQNPDTVGVLHGVNAA